MTRISDENRRYDELRVLHNEQLKKLQEQQRQFSFKQVLAKQEVAAPRPLPINKVALEAKHNLKSHIFKNLLPKNSPTESTKSGHPKLSDKSSENNEIERQDLLYDQAIKREEAQKKHQDFLGGGQQSLSNPQSLEAPQPVSLSYSSAANQQMLQLIDHMVQQLQVQEIKGLKHLELELSADYGGGIIQLCCNAEQKVQLKFSNMAAFMASRLKNHRELLRKRLENIGYLLESLKFDDEPG